jgi:hypothetical protein
MTIIEATQIIAWAAMASLLSVLMGVVLATL